MGLAVRSPSETTSSAPDLSARNDINLDQSISSIGPSGLAALGEQFSAFASARLSLMAAALNSTSDLSSLSAALNQHPGENEFVESCLDLRDSLEERRVLDKAFERLEVDAQRLKALAAQRNEELSEFSLKHPDQSAFSLRRNLSTLLKLARLGSGPDDEFSKIKAKDDEAKVNLENAEKQRKLLLKESIKLDSEILRLTLKAADHFFSRLIVDRSELEQRFWRSNLTSKLGLDEDQTSDSIFTFLNRQATADQIKAQAELVSKLVAPEIAQEISIRVKEIVEYGLLPGADDRAYGAPLSLDSLPTGMFTGLSDLNYWSELKNGGAIFALFPRESVARAEAVVVNKIFERLLELERAGDYQTETLLAQLTVLGSAEAIKPLLTYIAKSPECEEANLAFCAVKEIASSLPKSGYLELNNALTPDEQELLRILVAKDSFANRFECSGSQFCDFIRHPIQAFAYEKLCAILSKSDIDPKEIENFYYHRTGGSLKEIVTALLRDRASVERAIVSHPGRFWQEKFDKLLVALVDPGQGDISSTFRHVVTAGLNVTSPELLATLDQLLTSKSFIKSSFERQALLEGLLYLSTKEHGGEIVKTLLSRYRGSSKDPSRIRAIIQELATLDELGSFELSLPDPDKIKDLESEKAELKEAILQEQNKATRKEYKDRIEGIEQELSELHGLTGLERAMQERALQVTWSFLKLPSSGTFRVGTSLTDLKQQGFFEIIPTLVGNFESCGHQKANELLCKIARHILQGDFSDWRYSHELSPIQLAGLSNAQVKLWMQSQTLSSVENLPTHAALDTDDPLKLLKIGAEPIETCQSWRNGDYIECLLAYVADSNKRLVQIVDEHGKVILRSVIKLVDQAPSVNGKAVGTSAKSILIEKQYGATDNPEAQRVFIQLLLKKALAMNIPLTVGDDFEQPALRIFDQEARKLGCSWLYGDLKISFPDSINQDEYSDLLNGPLSQFDNTCVVPAYTLKSNS